MIKEKFKKQAYIKPTCEMFTIEIENLLQSVSGQHQNIGQGGSYGDAKRGWFEEEEEEEILETGF